ncbi:uncharacterized protein LOC123268103 [Cotesia glomerata]|uniref:uncharacterized protein LOC123268103 n=1 Tax=Cotesia glomerata TaxID=32391 RepID=UPI001D034C8D|nr:uncharacterized protein LOC123268103 [Cotesia glomerata]
MDRKYSRGTSLRACRTRKRKPLCNLGRRKSDTSFASASAAKLHKATTEDVIIGNTYGYCILEFFSVFTALSSVIVCSTCKKSINFSRTAARGLGFQITLKCSCPNEHYINLSPSINKAFEINRRIVAVMRLLGVGREGINIFCSMMDICHGVSISMYYLCMDQLYKAASSVYESVISKAVEEEKELMQKHEPDTDSTHLTVSGDGTWKKRGFNSLFGVTTLVGKYSKKVIDTVVKSSFCQGCNLWKGKKNSDIEAYNDWYEEHQDTCTINHKGSSGKMEVDSVVEMFSRSEDKHGVKLVKYIGDGDSKTFKGILDINPYDGDPVVIKKECVGHVQKRMGSRLRKAKKNNTGIGGKGPGKLTDKVINELSLYYGLAIRRNPESVENMKNEGSSSWCKWQVAEAEETLDEFQHNNPPLTEAVQKVIKPIYEDLSSESLLERCLGSETQNNNESLNSLIWTFAPKHIHAGTHTIEIANFIAVCIFNEGFLPVLRILSLMGITIGPESHAFVNKRDQVRINRSEVRATEASKETRTAKSSERASLNMTFEFEEGTLYGAGIAD